MQKYYIRFQLLSRRFFWRPYLRWAYGRCIHDLRKIQQPLNFAKHDFSALLCGVSGEITADEFLNFALNKNKSMHIHVIDVEHEQTRAVAKLVKKKYPKAQIHVQKANALDLSHIPSHSIDWIETDALLEYFDDNNLHTVLQEWKRLLKADGVITLREFASNNWFETWVDRVRIWLVKVYLGEMAYMHPKTQLEKAFKKNKFKFVSGLTPFLALKRYTLINR